MTALSKAITRTQAVVIIVILVAVGVSGYYGLLPVLSPAKPVEITAQMDFTFGGTHIPFFVALDQGYYSKEGLTVNLKAGTGSATTIKNVGTHLVDFGLADTITGMLGIANIGVLIKAVGIWHPSSVICYQTIEGYGINTPKDLEGKRFGAPPGDVGIVLLPLFGQVAGFDANKVINVNMDPSIRITALLQHRIDFMAGLDGSALQAGEIAIQRQGLKQIALCFRDYGINIFGHALFTNDDFLKQHPDAVGKFVKATYEGVQFTISHPDEAAKIMLKYNQQLDSDITLLQSKVHAKVFNSSDQRNNYLGYIDPSKMNTTFDAAVKYFGVKTSGLGDFYTAQYVQAANIQYPALAS